jgi:hypothetical protein
VAFTQRKALQIVSHQCNPVTSYQRDLSFAEVELLIDFIAHILIPPSVAVVQFLQGTTEMYHTFGGSGFGTTEVDD